MFINKIEREYYYGDYSVIKKLANIEVDFYTLQNLLVGKPTSLPYGIGVYYQWADKSYPYPFFSMLMCNYYAHSLQLDVKKVTFNQMPTVSATVPKNFAVIDIDDLMR